jgi:hypothetical protein
MLIGYFLSFAQLLQVYINTQTIYKYFTNPPGVDCDNVMAEYGSTLT